MSSTTLIVTGLACVVFNAALAKFAHFAYRGPKRVVLVGLNLLAVFLNAAAVFHRLGSMQ